MKKIIAIAVLVMLAGCSVPSTHVSNGHEATPEKQRASLNVEGVQKMFGDAFDRSNREARANKIGGMFSDAFDSSNASTEAGESLSR